MAAALRRLQTNQPPSPGSSPSRRSRARRRRSTSTEPLTTRGSKPQSQRLRSLTPDRHLHAVPSAQVSSPLIKTLNRLQIGSAVMAAVLVGLALGSYSYSVYIDRQLNRSSHRLSQLRRSEQQLTSANEVLKHHLAQQAEKPDIGLQPPNPKNVIFLQPVSSPAPHQIQHPGMGLPPISDVLKPLGY